MNNLRKISFREKNYEFNPDANDDELAKELEMSTMRDGYFHKWIEEPDNSKDIPYIKTMALVEDAKDHKLHTIDYTYLEFIE